MGAWFSSPVAVSTMPGFGRGGTVKHIQPWKVYPLFDDDLDLVLSKLPLHEKIQVECPKKIERRDHRTTDSRMRRHMRKIMDGQDKDQMAAQISVFCLQLVNDDEFRDVLDLTDRQKETHDVVDGDEGQSADDLDWNFVREKIKLQKWHQLRNFISKRLLVVAAESPLHAYAVQCLPRLDKEGRAVVVETLKVPTKLRTASVLRLTKLIQDSYPPSRDYGVLLREIDYVLNHSCVPNAVLEWRSSGDLSITALYELADKEEIALCLIPNSESVEERDGLMQTKFGFSCTCTRCRYEMNSLGLESMTTAERLRLANFYFANNKLSSARAIYQLILEDENGHADSWHALGAIELSFGHFRKAQRIWKDAASKFPYLREHKGLGLQIQKMEKYGYELLVQSVAVKDKPETRWISQPLTGVFLTRMLDQTDCARILEWAGNAQWTQQRHYAVPTNDVPVHAVEPLVVWFNEWMQQRVRPLFAHLFRTSPYFYVHDAFVVRYQGSEVSNHLPIHTDESSHSFVLALNDCSAYEGGGTCFFVEDEVIRLKVGELLSFRGDRILHGGEAVISGTRYILAAFLYHDDSDGSTASKRQKRNQSEDVTHRGPDFAFGFQL